MIHAEDFFTVPQTTSLEDPRTSHHYHKFPRGGMVMLPDPRFSLFSTKAPSSVCGFLALAPKMLSKFLGLWVQGQGHMVNSKYYSIWCTVLFDPQCLLLYSRYSEPEPLLIPSSTPYSVQYYCTVYGRFCVPLNMWGL